MSAITPEMFASQEVYNAYVRLVNGRAALRILSVGLRSHKFNLKSIKSACGLQSTNVADALAEINKKIDEFQLIPV